MIQCTRNGKFEQESFELLTKWKVEEKQRMEIFPTIISIQVTNEENDKKKLSDRTTNAKAFKKVQGSL